VRARRLTPSRWSCVATVSEAQQTQQVKNRNVPNARDPVRTVRTGVEMGCGAGNREGTHRPCRRG